MSLILAYTSPARGHLFPLTPILDELRRRGHEIVLRTLASEVETMRGRGIEAGPIDPAIEAIEHDDWQARGQRTSVQRSVATFCARAEHDGPDLRRTIEAERPDAAIVDIATWGAMSAAEAWGGPWAAFCPHPLPLPSRDAPPFGPGLPPARGPLGRLRDRALKPILFGGLERIVLPPLNRIRSPLGLRELRDVEDLYSSPPLLLYMTAEPFEYPRADWPDSVVMVGPCDWDPPAEPLPLLDRIEAPIVLVTTSSEFQDDARLVRASLAALADEPIHVIATLPSAFEDDIAAPANASVLRFAPHGAILDRAVCAVTHGGMGATQKALVRGVPVCTVPFGRDQFEVARRVEVAAAGSRLPARRLRADRLLAKVREATGLTEGARAVAASFAAAGGAVTAADAFEARLLGRA
jgi:UDP:flavonoid glycosyltransferase YjiC (YdhE family)